MPRREPRHQRQNPAGVGPRRHCKKADPEPMPLAIGSSLGPYEVLALIGAGGMGEVYRARDTKLGRDVALKILPEIVASDPDRLARFQREAQVLASLNHQNIAAIHGLEESNGIRALVLELTVSPLFFTSRTASTRRRSNPGRLVVLWLEQSLNPSTPRDFCCSFAASH